MDERIAVRPLAGETCKSGTVDMKCGSLQWSVRMFFFSTLISISLIACANGDELETVSSTYVYECGDEYSFTARIEDDVAWLFLPDETVQLPHVESASGVKFSDGKYLFWSKGEEALLEFDQGNRFNCRNNVARAVWEAAKLDGVDFRAVGNEPGWELRISNGDQIAFVTDYGGTHYEFTAPNPQTDQEARKTQYRIISDSHEMEVILDGRSCQDTMSDETFETTVTVRLDGTEYRGCGKALH